MEASGAGRTALVHSCNEGVSTAVGDAVYGMCLLKCAWGLQFDSMPGARALLEGLPVRAPDLPPGAVSETLSRLGSAKTIEFSDPGADTLFVELPFEFPKAAFPDILDTAYGVIVAGIDRRDGSLACVSISDDAVECARRWKGCAVLENRYSRETMSLLSRARCDFLVTMPAGALHADVRNPMRLKEGARTLDTAKCRYDRQWLFRFSDASGGTDVVSNVGLDIREVRRILRMVAGFESHYRAFIASEFVPAAGKSADAMKGTAVACAVCAAMAVRVEESSKKTLAEALAEASGK